MATIYEVTDIFYPKKDLKKTEVNEGFNLSDYVTNEEIFYYIYINNKKSDKDVQLHSKDIVLFIPKLQGTFAIGIIIAIIIAAAVYFFLDTNIPTINGLPEPDPVYTLKGQQNQIKKGESIEKHYGEVRHWPSYASRPYNQFIDNDQWLYMLLCIGVGEYIVNDVFVDDTPLSNFENAEFEVYLPNEKVTLFPTHVQTSSEIGGIELLGPNELDYDWSGPFIVVNSQSLAYRLEIDLSLRQGLYSTNKKGNLQAASVTALFEYRKIDDAGTPIGGWLELHVFSITLATVNSNRYTFSVNVPNGRYEIRGKRTNNKSSDFKIKDTLHWESARSYIVTDQNFGNVTLLAIKLKASNNINDNSRNNFNVRIRSKSYKYVSGSWIIAENKNPIWSFCDILLADYGRNLATKFLDLDTIVSLAAELDEEEIYFNGTFDTRGTVWQALTECLMLARCRPNLTGTLISIVRDVAMSVPTICLNPHNIIPNSFKVSHSFPRANDKDGLEVEYINSVTWKRETVLCLIENDRGINPEKVILVGCTDRDKAYKWGKYQRANSVYNKTNVTLTTGLEGSTVTFGDLAAIQHDLLPANEDKIPEHTGKIVDIYIDDTDTIVQLPFEPIFEDGLDHRIGISDTQGKMRGPYLCTKGDNNNVIITGVLDLSFFTTNSDEERPSYFFGVTGQEVSFFKVIGISPSSSYGEVNLTLSPYDARIYSYTSDEAPAISNDFIIPETPISPTVTNLEVFSIPNSLTKVNVTWSSSLGAIDYSVEISYDNINYNLATKTSLTNAVIDIEAGVIWVKVTAFGLQKGVPSIWTGTVGIAETVPFKPDTPISDDFSSSLYVSTDEQSLASSYKWKIYILNDTLTTLVLISTETTTLNQLEYRSSKAKSDAIAASVTLKRDITIKAIAVNSFGDSEESDELEITNTLPETITGLSAIVIQDLTGTKRCLFSWISLEDLDIESYKLYVKTVSGTPTISDLVYSSNSDFAEIILTTGTTYYYHVGVKDRWGEEIVLSAQSTFTP